MSHRIRVLAVEDDFEHFLLVQRYLAEPDAPGLDCETVRAGSLSEALELLSREKWDAVLMDLMLPPGLDALRIVQEKAPGVAILITARLGDEAVALEAMRLGAQDFILNGGPDFRMLKRAVRYAVERKAALEQRDQVIRAAADGMIVVDASGDVRLVNPAAERLFQAEAASLLGKPFPYPTRVGETGLIEIPRPPLPPLVVEMRVSPLSWNFEPAVLACLRDVGEVRRFEEMKTEVAQRRHADEMKDEWIARISHELRTPLTIIKGAITELADGQAEPLQPDQATLVRMTQHQLKRIERLILNLLELSRLESGWATVVRGKVDAAAVVRMTVEALQHAAAQRAVALTSRISEPVGLLDADADLFEQLVMNLADNALRFARSRVIVSLASAKPSGVELSVEDDGVGIPPEKQGLLFSKYAQLDRPRGPEGYKGTGLGLAICKEIVGLHRGVIKVESARGGGAVFRVLLPDLTAEAASSPEPRRAAGAAG